MSTYKPNILIVEDDEAAAFGYKSFLSDSNYDVQSATTLKEAGIKLEAGVFDAVLLDLRLPDGNALHWIPKQKQAYPDMPIIVISGTGDIPTAVQATKNGAENFLTKPVELDDLLRALSKSLELKALRKKNIIQQRLIRNEEPYFGTSLRLPINRSFFSRARQAPAREFWQNGYMITAFAKRKHSSNLTARI